MSVDPNYLTKLQLEERIKILEDRLLQYRSASGASDVNELRELRLILASKKQMPQINFSMIDDESLISREVMEDLQARFIEHQNKEEQAALRRVFNIQNLDPIEAEGKAALIHCSTCESEGIKYLSLVQDSANILIPISKLLVWARLNDFEKRTKL